MKICSLIWKYTLNENKIQNFFIFISEIDIFSVSNRCQNEDVT